MADILFCSDLHFYHSNIIRYSSRPYSDVAEMNYELIHNWNEIVKPDDVVYNLGDFSFGSYDKTRNVLKQLNGKIHFIYGNHDKVIKKHEEELLGDGLLVSTAYDREIYVGKQMLVLHHYGKRVWNKSHHGSIHLYGHSHGSLPPYGKSVDVGVDCKEITDEYRPVHIDEVLAYMATRNQEVVDHHGT